MPLSRLRPLKTSGPMLSKDFISRRVQEALDDQAPGTSTEEDFIEDEDEDDRMEWEDPSDPPTPVSSTTRTSSSPPRRLKRAHHAKVPAELNEDRRSLVFKLFRWPALAFILIFMLMDLICYFTIRYWVHLTEILQHRFGSTRRYFKRMESAKSYSEWKSAASELDKVLKLDSWKWDPESIHFDFRLVQKIARRLKRFRTQSKVRDLCRILKHSGCKTNAGGIHSEQVYSFTYFGTKHLIDEYVAETIQALEFVAKSPEMDVSSRQVVFKNLSKIYGRTALCLSGGASLGYYHVGVVKALFENRLLPSVITGASAGSLIAALVCCRTDEELKSEVFKAQVLQPRLTALQDSASVRLSRYRRTGAMFEFDDWLQKMEWFTKGHMTFLEAFLRTGRILNVSVVSDEPHAQPKLLNYITAPDVVISSAVIASSAIPGVLRPVQLLRKDENGFFTPFRGAGKFWRDGSLRTDIPERELTQLFNVQYTIVSQMNPHIVLFFYNAKGSSGSPSLHRYGKGYRGGFINSSLVHHFLLDLQKWLALLRDMDLFPRILGADFSNVWLQKFEGTVTILPPLLSLEDFRTILSDPSVERLQHQMDKGQLQTWPKLRNIENRMRIEQSLTYWRQHLNSLLETPLTPESSNLVNITTH